MTEHARIHHRDHIADPSCSSLCLTPGVDGGSQSGPPVLTEHVSCHLEKACFLTSPWYPLSLPTWCHSPSSGVLPQQSPPPPWGLGHVSDGAGPSWAFRGSSRYKNSQVQDSLLADTRPSVCCFLLLLLLLLFFKLILFLAVLGLHCCEGCSLSVTGGGCYLVVTVCQAGLFSSCDRRGSSLVVTSRPVLCFDRQGLFSGCDSWGLFSGCDRRGCSLVVTGGAILCL